MPKSENGKAKSSLNALKHGSCSKVLIVGEETPEEFEELHARWFSGYDAEQAGRSLLEETVLNEWLLKRAQRNQLTVEARMGGTDPNDWTPEQFHRLHLMVRYKTAAERSFHRSVAAVERFRRVRVYEGFAQERAQGQREKRAEKRERQAVEEEEKPVQFKLRPRIKHPPSVVQQVWVRRTDGETGTTLWPTNAELAEQMETTEPRPVRVFRDIHIFDWLPPEYEWVVENLPGESTWRPQVMTVEEWRRAVEREKTIEGGHVGPVQLDASWNDGWEDTPRDD